MKMRRTIYPAALIIAIPLVLLVFYILNQGKFEKTAALEQSADVFHVDGKMYVQVELEWKGFGNPVLKSLASKETMDDDVQAFVNQTNSEASLEQAVEQMSAGEKLPEVAEYKLMGNTMSLILEMNQEDFEQMQGETTFLLRYRTFGITREQEISLPEQEEELTFQATILQHDDALLVEPAEGEAELQSADEIVISTEQTVLLDAEGEPLELEDFTKGDLVEIAYDGIIAESHPAQIHQCMQIQMIENK